MHNLDRAEESDSSARGARQRGSAAARSAYHDTVTKVGRWGRSSNLGL